jgi:hypothetical protein
MPGTVAADAGQGASWRRCTVLPIAVPVIHNRSRQHEAVAFARMRHSRLSRRQACSR